MFQISDSHLWIPEFLPTQNHTNSFVFSHHYSLFFLVNVCINHTINLHYYMYSPFLFCRPENTHKGKPFAIQQDLNKLYWIDDTAKVSVSKIQGKCDVVCLEDLSVSIEEYFRKGQDRFYFTEVCFYSRSFRNGGPLQIIYFVNGIFLLRKK